MHNQQTHLNMQKVRQDTPGCEHVLHFNNAGAALMPQPVLDAVTEHLQLEAMIGGYEAADAAHEKIEHVYDSIATLLNCRREEVAIIENATRAWDMAFYGILFMPGDRILTAKASYASNYIAFLHMAEREGVIIDVIPDDKFGQLSVPALRDMMDERVQLIAITHMPTNGGLVNPAAEVGQIAREANVLYLLDACQSVGQLPIDVEAIGCDMLSATGRKWLRGPRGTGFLYIREAVLSQLDPPFLDLHAATWTATNAFEVRADARRFETWETNFAGKIGLGVAVDYAMKLGMDAIWERVCHLSQMLREKLARVSGVTVHDLGRVQGGIVTFVVDGVTPNDVKRILREQKINVSTTTHFSTRLDMESRGLDEMVRASIHYYNTEAEIERFITAVSRLRP
ncbi:MAG: aminotransferase class V-fold PLP-dependent enzyme [Chloroflexi bacterium]|nr:MAG: aminotransferase class V-fold PLP-dependent enzyme [Chloroflexota bacterium]